MPMQFRSDFLSLLPALLLAACGDNHLGPDAGPPDPDPDGGVDPVCRRDLAVGDLAGAWDARFTVPGLSGPDGLAPTVYDFARDVDGSIVAAGKFGYLGGAHTAPLVRLRNGAWEPARTTWELAPRGAGFSSVAISPDGALALATYDDFGPRSGEIWLDDGTGLRVIGTFDGLIRRLRWYDGALWAAGWDQIHQGDTVIQGLAVWDGTAWSAPPGGPTNGFAFELTVDNGELLVGGVFSQLGGVAAESVAAFDGAAWRALDFPESAVYALSRGPDGVLYAGGSFGAFGGPGAGGLARWDGAAWTLAGGGLGNHALAGVVTDLAEHDGSLYVSGCFVTAGGPAGAPGAITTRDVARYDGAWHALDDDTSLVLSPWYEPKRCGDEGPDSVWDTSKQVLFSDGDRVLLGGSFPGIAGTISQALIAHDGATWTPQGAAGGLGVGGSIDRLAIAGGSCEVWGSGQISHVGGASSRSHVVRFTGERWEPIADDLPFDAFCPAFAASQAGDVALGCLIFPAEGDAIGRVYRVEGSRLAQQGGDLPLISAIAYDATGALWLAGGGERGVLARLDGEALTIVDDTFDAPLNQLDVVSPTDVIVAGYFAKVGDVDAARIARWDGRAWRALGDGLPGAATAIAHDAETVYASTYDEGSGALLLGAFDGASWRELASANANLTPDATFNFNAIQPIEGAVIAVGSAVLDDLTGRGAVVYRDGRFTALGGGVNAILLQGLAVSHDAVWVGGPIAEAGLGAEARSTVGVARYVIAR